jgi:hypothetical protein
VPKQTCGYIEPTTGVRCHRVPKYLQYLVLRGDTNPRRVVLCDTCDKQQGRNALVKKNGWSLNDSIRLEKDPEYKPDAQIHRDRMTPPAIRSAAGGGRSESAVRDRKRRYERSQQGYRAFQNADAKTLRLE